MKILSQKDVDKITNTLLNNGVIAFPTDTVWGVGCLVNSKPAVEKIYSLKGRDAKKPLILLGKDVESLKKYVDAISPKVNEMINKYLPGALTIVIKKNILTPDYITSGFDTVGIRIPDNKTFLDLLDRCVEGHVLATTSANLSGNNAANSKDDVINEIGELVDYIVDDYGNASKGIESTVIFVDSSDKITVLRQGSIKIEENND